MGLPLTKRRSSGEDWIGSLPGVLTLLWLVPFFFVPLALLAAYTFASQNYLTGQVTFDWTLDAWQRIGDPVVVDAFGRSVAAAAVTTLATAVVGYPTAYFVARHAGRFQALARVLVIVPFWVSFIVRAYARVDLLADRGLINRLLVNTGIASEPAALVNNMFGVLLGLVYVLVKR